MTQMSEPRRFRAGGSRLNHATARATSGLARTLHDPRAIVRTLTFVLFGGGCVIPPSLSSSTADAGVNSPPMIVDVKSQTALQEGSTVTFDVINPDPITIDLLDTDVTDTLYVRIFVDYNKPDQTSPRVTCAPTGGSKTPQRTVICPIGGLCGSTDINQPRGMSIVVFDREPIDGMLPYYQAMPPDGLSTDRFYYLNCQ
jgi:hypothetical protein